MLIALLLSLTAQAGPQTGFRVNACAGFGTHCPIFQIGFAYTGSRVGVDVGGFLGIPFGAHAGLQYYVSGDEKNRTFVGASVGGGSIAVVSVGGYGLHIGRDFHLGSSNIIVTPRIGADTGGFVIFSADGDGSVSGIAPSISLETSVRF